MINENKKGVRAVKHTVKTKNPVAKAHQTVGTGSGGHKDKKKSADQIRGQKHKNKELAEFAALAPIAGAVGRAVVGGIARSAVNAFANDDDEPTENFDDAEYNDEAGMADNNLETLHRAVVGLDELISDGDNLPEWCQEKIAVAKSMLVSVWDYMQSEGDDQNVKEFAKKGLYYNVNKRKKAGTSRPASSPKAPTAQAWKDAAKTAKKEGVAEVAGAQKCWPGHRKVGTQPGTGKNKGKRVNDCEKISESNWYELRLQMMLNETLKK